LNWTYGLITDKYLPQALKALAEMLMDTPASPLKKVIRDSGYAKDSFVYVHNDILQPTISLICKHTGNPMDYLAFEPMLKELRRGLEEPYFENLIEKVLLYNKHSHQIVFEPVPGLIQKKEQETAAKLAELKKKMSKKEITKLLEFNQQLIQWQQEPEKRKKLGKNTSSFLIGLKPPF
jgi:Zn-dependent M16 (insulinase) family peptidase